MSPLLYLAGVVAAGTAAQWLAWRLKLPAILLLLAAGFAFGQIPVTGGHGQPEPIGEESAFDATAAEPVTEGAADVVDEGGAGHAVTESDTAVIPERLLGPAVALAVAVILFEGGLSLKFRELREVGGAALGLCTLGAGLTWVLAAVAGKLLVFDTWALAVLAGAVFTVTGPTVIVPLLRQIRPSAKVGAAAKWEGIVIDPVGAMLAVLTYEAIVLGPQAATVAVPLALAKTIAVGLVIGVGVAFAFTILYQRHYVPDYLQNPVMLGAVLLSFAASNVVQPESGLVTVTVMGVVLANQRRFDIEPLVEFKENLGVLLISVLFVVLAGQLEPRSIYDLGWRGAAFIGVLVLLVRPAAVFLGTIKSTLTPAERAFLGWLAPRGIVAAAVASVFALELRTEALAALDPAAADPTDLGRWRALLEDSERLVPLTFLVISATVALYGLTAGPVARRLGLAEPNPQGVLFLGGTPVVRSIAVALQERGFKVKIIDSNRKNVAAARLDGIKTRHGNALSEQLIERIDAAGLGRVLAMTPNDEVNSLAARNFAAVFGRSGCYQLTPAAAGGKGDQSKGEGGADKAVGRPLFREGVTFRTLQDLHDRGAEVKDTRITEEFDYPSFLRLHGADSVVLFKISGAAGGKGGGKKGEASADRTLSVNTADRKLNPQPGDVLLSLIPPPTDGDEDSAVLSAGQGIDGETDSLETRPG